jgi:hypothetical protein
MGNGVGRGARIVTWKAVQIFFAGIALLVVIVDP